MFKEVSGRWTKALEGYEILIHCSNCNLAPSSSGADQVGLVVLHGQGFQAFPWTWISKANEGLICLICLEVSRNRPLQVWKSIDCGGRKTRGRAWRLQVDWTAWSLTQPLMGDWKAPNVWPLTRSALAFKLLKRARQSLSMPPLFKKEEDCYILTMAFKKGLEERSENRSQRREEKRKRSRENAVGTLGVGLWTRERNGPSRCFSVVRFIGSCWWRWRRIRRRRIVHSYYIRVRQEKGASTHTCECHVEYYILECVQNLESGERRLVPG